MSPGWIIYAYKANIFKILSLFCHHVARKSYGYWYVHQVAVIAGNNPK